MGVSRTMLDVRRVFWPLDMATHGILRAGPDGEDHRQDEYQNAEKSCHGPNGSFQRPDSLVAATKLQ
jgi:hypothetical protein